MRVVALLFLVFAAAACGDDIRGDVSIAAPPVWRTAVGEFVSLTNNGHLSLGEDGDFKIHLVIDPSIPVEGYRIDRVEPDRWTVSAREVLGAQYGLAAALENLGYRFRHPFAAYVPDAPRDRGAELGVVHQPEVRVRGLQLHTLHPMETYFAFWEPGPGSTNDAHRVIDWLVKNRGNYVHWVALDDIMDPDIHAKWKVHTQEIIEYAHMRGVRVGLNIQLFGGSNLQLAFDLHDDDDVPVSQSIAERFPLITQDLPFDTYVLSFGEFFGEEPQMVVDGINEFARQGRQLAPQAEFRGFVHVGATQRIDYMNENLLYYFLIKFADPGVVPDIHTVMYYNLFDDAGGAYQHDEFNEHREYLIQLMCANKPHGYVPESGYWVAFDNSVPAYVPLYVYSRWRDIEGLANTGCKLDNHVLFTTGWEWGFWLHDVANLRDTYEHATAPADLIVEAYGPDMGRAGADVIAKVMDEQKRALIDERLAGYMASRDVIIDAGDMLDPPIISQPRRVLFHEIPVTGFDVDAFEANVLAPLGAHADNLEALQRELEALDLPDTRWGREVRDGFRINAVRARFMHELYTGVVAHARGGNGVANHERAAELMADAKIIVEARHSDLHDTHRRRLLDRTPNATYYQYGYLYHADILCYWQRELDEVGAILGNTTTAPPGCLF